MFQISSLALSTIGLIVAEDVPTGERMEFLEGLLKKVSNHPEAKIKIMAKVRIISLSYINICTVHFVISLERKINCTFQLFTLVL